jgi:hypothetical protein
VAKLNDGSYHGATLSSFSSIALQPEPLVSFSLRLPSRLAGALRLGQDTISRSIHSGKESDDKQAASLESPVSPYFSINIMSGHPACETIAQRFSQAQANHEAALSDPKQWRYIDVDGRIEKDSTASAGDVAQKGIPVARNGMTTLLCQTVSAIPLSNLVGSSTGISQKQESTANTNDQQYPVAGEEGSMLFIARVVQVIKGEATDVLVYKDRKYLAVK